MQRRQVWAQGLTGETIFLSPFTTAPTSQAQSAPGAPRPKSGSGPSALAAPTYLLTVAALKCPTYAEIMANRARNNIMQSLQNVGPNSNYSGGTSVNPTTETLPSANQQNRQSLVGWDMKLGTGIGGANAGPWGSLSFVSNPYPTAVQTQASVPLLNSTGGATGSNLAGATTIQLTAAQVTAATDHNLWIQGGVPGAPLNGDPNIAFGALRCAIDNYNGDNVEWIAYPAGATHVFCYAVCRHDSGERDDHREEDSDGAESQQPGIQFRWLNLVQPGWSIHPHV